VSTLDARNNAPGREPRFEVLHHPPDTLSLEPLESKQLFKVGAFERNTIKPSRPRLYG